MIIHDVEQGSTQWLYKRCGIPTASEFNNLVTPKRLEVRRGQQMDAYVAFKLAERWGGPIMSFHGGTLEQGTLIEEAAFNWYQWDIAKIKRVGFITTDDGRIGCSPDAWHLDDTAGVEIKSPQRPNQVKYLLAGQVPPEYVMQVQGSMLVTGLELWRFCAYSRHLPCLVLNVHRDEAIQEALHDALQLFHEKFDAGMERLVELNDGKPPPPLAVPEKMVFSDDIAAGRAEDPDEAENFDVTP